jgi:uncharacterized protein YdaU (DUF1376 family)
MIQFPWYKWHSARWLSSRSRLTMNTSERSIYRDLLDHLYIDGNIPTDPKALAMMAAVSEEEFDRAWPVVSRRFTPHPDEPNALTNANAEDEMRDRDEKSDAGARGGRPRLAERCPCGAMTKARAEKRGHRCQECQKADALQTERETQTERTERDKDTENNTCAPQGDARDCLPPNSSKRKSPLQGGKKGSAEQEAWFFTWWEIYWLKKSKKAAFVAFCRHVTSAARFEEVMAATRAQSPEMLRREEKHRPHGATWLNGERWLDPTEEPRRDPILDAMYPNKE